jgi:hemerythrin
MRADHRLKYYASPFVRASVTKKLSALMATDEKMFFDCFDVQDLELNRWNEVNGLDVMPLLSPHPVETNILMFRALARDGYRTYGHWADVVARDVLHGMIAQPGKEGISQEFFDRVIADYQRPVDLKKVDVGGGLIHGQAEDFRFDNSDRIRLSHLDRNLSEDEQEIGSASPFGTVDVLITGNQDFDARDAFEYLRDYFPFAGQRELASLLNCQVRIDRPGTTLLRAGDAITRLPLIISGTVERVSGEGVKGGGFTAGSLIGEVSGLAGRPSSYSYRCRSYVKSLQIPLEMLRQFLERNQIQDALLQRAETRSFLRSTEICRTPLAETTLTRLAQASTRHFFEGGETINIGDNLGLVVQGSVHLFSRSRFLASLDAGQVFNQERAMFGHSSAPNAIAEAGCEICCLPASSIRGVPVLRWVLLEMTARRNFADVAVAAKVKQPKKA